MIEAQSVREVVVTLPDPTWSRPGEAKPVADVSVHWDRVWVVTDAPA